MTAAMGHRAEREWKRNSRYGLLGPSYSGYFPPRDTRALARLLARFERDGAFRARLRREVLRVAPLFDPRREARAWRHFLRDLERSRGR